MNICLRSTRRDRMQNSVRTIMMHADSDDESVEGVPGPPV